MGQLYAAFGSSHSIMLAATPEDWVGAFRESDRKMPLFDKTGMPRNYDELLAVAPSDSAGMVTPEKMLAAHKRTFRAVADLKRHIEATDLDALVVIGDDQHELFQDSMMPSLAIFYGETIRNAPRAAVAKSDWYRRAQQERLEPEREAYYPVHGGLALHLIEGLAANGFEACSVRAIPADQHEGHAFSYIHRTYLGDRALPIVPVMLNTYYPPNQMTPKRCVELGLRLKDVIQSYPAELRVAVLASGGLSHFVVDEDLDRGVIEAMRTNHLDHLAALDPKRLQAGSSEIRSWIVTAAAASAANLDLKWIEYIPAYRTPALTGTGLVFARWG
jgi:3-O-methylgallate 3,4-dioxygenase